MSTSTLVSASGWHNGISSCVFFAAMMPAMRAAPSTSPFFASPLSTRLSVLRVITTRPSATATRSVPAFADTSTMRASPRRPRWVSFAMQLPGSRDPCGGTREQRFGRGGNIFLPHQAFANQKGRYAGPIEAGEIGGCEDAALADHNIAFGDERSEPLGCLQRRLEGLQIAV